MTTLGNKPVLLVIVGPTAIGKSALALEICRRFNGEIISADSRQFYRELTIGTAKPSIQELEEIPHHFVNTLHIHEEYTAGKFEHEALKTIDDIVKRGALPVLIGGSGLYIKAVLEGLDNLPADAGVRAKIQNLFDTQGIEPLQTRLKELDPEHYRKIDSNNPVRLIRAIEILELSKGKMKELFKNTPKPRNFEPLIIGLERPREDLYKRIEERVDEMMERGLEAEVRNVADFKTSQALQSMGYREFFPYFDGEYDLERTVELIKQNTRKYAKRQLTWLRKVDDIHLFYHDDYPKIFDFLSSVLNPSHNK